MVRKIEKLLKKISRQDRKRLLETIKKLVNDNTKDLNIKKIKNTDFYRIRNSRFRIIFHLENGQAIIDSVKLRDEKTYKKL